MTDATGKDDQSEIEALYDDCVDRLMRGEDVDLDALCARHPRHADTLRLHLSALRAAARNAKKTPSRLTPARRPMPAADGMPFERLGEFRLVRLLGKGGMGAVYLAEQEFLGRLVALKVIRPELGGFSAAKGRFQREIDAVAKLRHQNIVTVYSAGEDQGVPYLVMELVPGRGLDELLDAHPDQPLPLAQALGIGAQIARALQCAHEQGILHRDVKPSNIRVTPDGRALLLDFGLARSKESAAFTKTGEFQGTPHYVAPEQIGGKFGEQDGRVDVFALGATLYECVTGRLPFPGENTEDVLRRILFEEPKSPRVTNPLLKKDVETVLLKALEKDPARRYASAQDFADDLDALLALAPIKARPPGPMRRAGQWMRGHKIATAFSGALLVLGIGIAGTKGLELQRVRASVHEDLAAATRALDASDFDGAENAYRRALAKSPSDLAASLGLRSVAPKRAEHLEAEARAIVDRVRGRLAERQFAANMVDTLHLAMTERFVTPAEEKQLAQNETTLRTLNTQLDEDEFEVREVLQALRPLSWYGEVKTADADAIAAEFWMTHWRAAVESGDEAIAATMRPRVERYDHDHKHTAELDGLGSVAIQVEPSGARIHLFRYADHRTLVKDGEPRLVPVPVAQFAPPRPFGAWVLRVVGASQGLNPGDLITKVAGQPVRNTVLVARAAGDVKRFDKLASIDGQEIHDAFEAWYHEQLPPPQGASAHTYVFARKNADANAAPTTVSVTAAKLAAAGIEVGSPARLVERGDVPVETFCNGVVATLALVEGLQVRATGAPLYVGDATLTGVAPLAATALPPGSYLALLEAPAHESQRMPFVVRRGAEVQLAAKLQQLDATPDGFVLVPEGEFQLGGDLAVEGAVRASTQALPAFWIQEREVTFAEYAEFLNAPVSRARIASFGPSVVPRVVGDTRESVLDRDAQGKYVVPEGFADLPIYGVSFDGALAYAEWRTERGRANGSKLTFDLPTSTEWEKAARGADGRTLVCGNNFVASWLKSRHARPVTDVEPVLSFPVDESPYGAFDLGGSLNEWCKDVMPESPDLRIVRGGAWNAPRAEAFHAAYRHFVRAPTMASSIGFRLVARA